MLGFGTRRHSMKAPSVGGTEVPADARRVTACLKACEGIPTERLEDGVILRLVAACIHVDDPEIREILEELSPMRPRLVRR
jgi:hypothetical protein